MTTEINDQQRVESRAEHLLPEERTAGSDDPVRQAQAILADSDERESDSTERDSAATSVAADDAAPDTIVERRTSDEATAVVEPPD
ncbi:hypothetical protein ACWDV4_00590 [Micromonospora sp. NPDC003197]